MLLLAGSRSVTRSRARGGRLPWVGQVEELHRADAMSKQLSSRVQGLKFMQRGSARPPNEPDSSPSHTPTGPETPDTSTQEQWVVPAHARVQVAARPRAASMHWDTWLTSALEDKSDMKPRSRRCVFGKWDKPTQRHPESEDEFESDDDYASARSEPSSPETGFRKPLDASGPPRKRVAADSGDRRRKLASIASNQQGLRKKPKKDTVKRLR